MSLGRWSGVHLRLHSLFFLFASFTLLLGWHASLRPETPDALFIAGVSLGILLVSVTLHELGHLVVSHRLGGHCDELVLGPLGGISPLRTTGDAHADLMVYLAGPLVNLIICLLGGLGLLAIAGESLLPLLHPLSPSSLIDGSSAWLKGAKLLFWINWLLFLINLLPAYPFDGGRALRAALAGYWTDGDPRRPHAVVALVAKVVALGLLVAAFILLLRPAASGTLVPAWFALSILALFLYFSARQEEDRQEDRSLEDELFGYDFSQGYTSLERSTERREEHVGVLQQWLEQRRRVREERQLQVEADEESRVDEILTQVYTHGIESLSEDDRALLQRVSARYRQRR